MLSQNNEKKSVVAQDNLELDLEESDSLKDTINALVKDYETSERNADRSIIWDKLWMLTNIRCIKKSIAEYQKHASTTKSFIWLTNLENLNENLCSALQEKEDASFRQVCARLFSWVNNILAGMYDGSNEFRTILSRNLKSDILRDHVITTNAMQTAIVKYSHYTYSSFFRFIRRSSAADRAIDKMRSCSDQERYDVALDYVTKNPREAFAKELCQEAPLLRVGR